LLAAEGRRSPRPFGQPGRNDLRASVLECASPLALWATPVFKFGRKISCQRQEMWQYIGIGKPIIAKLWKNQKSLPI
jgi:hypothetical protein